LAALKCTSYAFHALHLRAARAAGADDALLLALDGRVLETTTGNLFLWLGDELHTPAITGGLLLPGVARAALIDELTNASVAVVERDIWLAELEPGAAVFVTNAVHGPRPAVVGTAAAPPARLDARVADAWQRVVG
jgi:branched-subunit amino acid aminotransferase/4-amino-4-deoxychorismate lyase